MRSGWSLAARFTVWFGLSAFIISLCSTGYLYFSLVSTFRSQNNQILADRIQTVRLLLSADPRNYEPLKNRIEKEWPLRPFERLYIRVVNSSGQIISQSPGLTLEMVQILEHAGPSSESVKSQFLAHFSLNENVRGYLSRVESVISEGSDEVFQVQLALDCNYEDGILGGYLQRSYLLLLFAGLLGLLFGWRIARRGTIPIYQMAEMAAQLGPSNLKDRIDHTLLPAELRSLALSFNSLLGRLEAAFERLSRFSADIAHELRTPINNIMGEMEVALVNPRSLDAYRDVLGSGLEESKKLSRIVDSLLFLARSENPSLLLRKESIDLRNELQAITDFHEASATEAGIECSIEAAGGINIKVEKTLFQRAVGNLFSNAIKHTRPGGRIYLFGFLADEKIIVGIEDTGCGISKKDLPLVFDRFYRVDSSRSKDSGGSGLGLAIVHSIAAIHGGTVRIDSELEKGTRVEIHLPVGC